MSSHFQVADFVQEFLATFAQERWRTFAGISTYPVYYSCDWDFDGLRIFQRVKSRLEDRGATIKILTPPPPHNYLPNDSFMHKSRWNYKQDFSGLDRKVFSMNEKELITKLIKDDLWIEEETIVLKEMYHYNLSSNIS